MPKPRKTSNITPIEKGARIVGDDRDKLKAALKAKYEAGATVRQLHQETGRSFGAIQRLLAESGVTMRPRGGARKSA